MLAVALFAAIALVSMGGGLVPLMFRLTHTRIQLYLSASAGVMLGAAFFHMLPHAAELIPRTFGLWTAVGVIGLYFVQRFVAPHSHEFETHSPEEVCASEHAHAHTHGADVKSPSVSAWTTFWGLAVHSVIGGMALGGAVFGQAELTGLAILVFLAIVIHKPADALAITSLMHKVGYARRRMFWVQVAFATMNPLGGLAMLLGGQWMSHTVESSVTGVMIALTAGTFICISLGDLLPEVHFHSHDRLKLAASLLVGLGIIYAASIMEQRSGVHEHERAATVGDHDAPADDHADHEH
jgi:zinc and cadmium transporter